MKVLTLPEISKLKQKGIEDYASFIGWDSFMWNRLKNLRAKCNKRVVSLRNLHKSRRPPKSGLRSKRTRFFLRKNNNMPVVGWATHPQGIRETDIVSHHKGRLYHHPDYRIHPEYVKMGMSIIGEESLEELRRLGFNLGEV